MVNEVASIAGFYTDTAKRIFIKRGEKLAKCCFLFSY